MTGKPFSWKSKRGLEIFAQDWAPGQPIRGVVGLVHGLGEHIGRYEHVATRLNRAGYALVGFDQPGHGRSGGKRGVTSFEESADEIDHLLQEIQTRYPGAPRFLYGHSMGALFTLAYTLKRKPDLRGVIATSPPLAAGSGVPKSKFLFAQVMARIAPTVTVANGLDRDNLSRDRAIIDAYAADPLVHPQVSARLGFDLFTLGPWVIEHAAEFPLPLLLEQGSQDHIVSYPATQAFARTLESVLPAGQVTFKGWEGFYHETHNEPEKQEVLQFMVDWLDRHV
jgi:alpha-beta hydrolase superfamily lysophospholipase